MEDALLDEEFGEFRELDEVDQRQLELEDDLFAHFDDEDKVAEQPNDTVALFGPTSEATPEKPKFSRIGISTNDKAGMQGFNPEKVNQVIYNMSKGSKFFQNEQRKEARAKVAVENMLKQRKLIGDLDGNAVKDLVDKKVEALEKARDLNRTWFHVDMDAFYASVEIRDNPALKGLPIAVGDASMISTSSYEARKFGVRSAMPGFIGKQLCPELLFVKPRYDKYREASKLTRDVFMIYDEEFEAYSLDEAALDLTDYLSEHQERTPEEVAKEMQAAIFKSTQLTCSVGIGCNKRLAKIAADVNKPNGCFRILPDRSEIVKYVSKMPCRKVSGIGKLFDNRCLLYKLFSERTFEFFMKASLGLGSVYHSAPKEQKSLGAQRTFRALSAKDELITKCKDLCDEVATRLQKKGKKGKKVTLFLKTAEFELRSKTTTARNYVDSSEDIFPLAKDLLVGEIPVNLRLLGVRVSDWPKDAPVTEEGQRPIKHFFNQRLNTSPTNTPTTTREPATYATTPVIMSHAPPKRHGPMDLLLSKQIQGAEERNKRKREQVDNRAKKSKIVDTLVIDD